jgi:hypothetical protein
MLLDHATSGSRYIEVSVDVVGIVSWEVCVPVKLMYYLRMLMVLANLGTMLA